MLVQTPDTSLLVLIRRTESFVLNMDVYSLKYAMFSRNNDVNQCFENKSLFKAEGVLSKATNSIDRLNPLPNSPIDSYNDH